MIPESNLDEVILNPNVEEAINNGDFVIYTMENISDAIMVLLGNNETSFEDIAASIDREIKKYKNYWFLENEIVYFAYQKRETVF